MKQRTYLEMRDPLKLKSLRCDDPAFELSRCRMPLHSSVIYSEVGRTIMDQMSAWMMKTSCAHTTEISLWLMTEDGGTRILF